MVVPGCWVVALELCEGWNSETSGPNIPSTDVWLDVVFSDVVEETAADLKKGKCTLFRLDEVAKK